MLRFGGLCYHEPLRGNRESHDHTWVVITTIESFGTEAKQGKENKVSPQSGLGTCLHYGAFSGGSSKPQPPWFIVSSTYLQGPHGICCLVESHILLLICQLFYSFFSKSFITSLKKGKPPNIFIGQSQVPFCTHQVVPLLNVLFIFFSSCGNEGSEKFDLPKVT